MELAKISSIIEGVKIMLNAETEILTYLRNEFILKENMDNTHCQNIALFIISNCLFVADTQQHIFETKHNFSTINTITAEETFFFKLFFLSLHSNRLQVKVNALSCIFSIIYNNNENFAESIITNSKYSIISFLSSLMQTALKK
jgi:hypothetical protein